MWTSRMEAEVDLLYGGGDTFYTWKEKMSAGEENPTGDSENKWRTRAKKKVDVQRCETFPGLNPATMHKE